MMADRVLDVSKRAVVHEGRLHGDVAQWRRAKLVAVGRIPADLLAAEVLVHSWSVEEVVGHQRRNLRRTDNVVLEIAEHLVGLGGDAVALDALCCAKEQQRALLLVVAQGVVVAAREAVDARIASLSGNV